MDLSALDHAVAAAAALGAGVVNAVAGGGTMLTFPTLIGLGVPAVNSNVTNTVALCPGYFGGTFAQRNDLVDQRKRLRAFVPVAALGGLIGSALLVSTSERVFRGVVPFLLLAACALLVFQDRIRAALPVRREETSDTPPGPGAMAAMFATCIYGGYFGAGLGIITLATLGVLLPDKLVRVNAVKQAVTFVANIVAALFFVFSGRVVWSLALVMAPAALVGGNVGGHLAKRMNAKVLRYVVAALGFVVAVRFWL
ncbi:MAG: sulfite exporter TauE/SafE family protein [Acidimicrobiia bacterium]|nr:sulfite exporter TauE/SafE family protein [Acidimicrobiia bacterium]